MSLNLNDNYSPATPVEIDVDQSDVNAALNTRTAFYVIAMLSIFFAVFVGFLAGDRMEDPILVLGPALGFGIFYILCGYFAGKLHIWAFVAGLAVYALDTVFVVLSTFTSRVVPYGLMVKAIILFYLVRGLLAALRVKAAVDASKL